MIENQKPPGKRAFCAPTPALLATALLVSSVPLSAQQFAAHAEKVQRTDPLPQRINLQAKAEKLQAVLQKLERQVKYVFVYSNDEVNGEQPVSIDVRNASLQEVLDLLMKQVGATYELINDKIILRNQPKPGSRPAGAGTQAGSAANADNVAAAPDMVVTGRVTDEAGKPVQGASVQVKGSNLATTTNANGEFSLTLPDNMANATLLISSVAFETREWPLRGTRTVSLSLQPSQKALEDVVVVGYGTQRRSSVSGAVDVVSSSAIAGRPVANLSTALQGTSPNLIIQQTNFEPGQGVNINIRGLGTLGDNTPLVVIDGIVGGDINLINPADIESVSILKDAGSAAIYGSRSANGVILITTKKGKLNTRATVSYAGQFGVQSPRITYTPVDAWKNAYYKNESLVNSGLAPAFSPTELRDFAARGNGDWRADNLFQDAPQQGHTISVNGGTANTIYNLSFGLLDQRSTFIGPEYGYKRYNIRFNQTTNIGKLRLNTILSYAKVQNKDHASSSGTLIVDAGRVPLYYSYTDSAGNYLTNPVSAQYNPKAILEKGGYRKSNDDEIFGNVNAEFQVTNHLKLRGVMGGTVRSNNGYARSVQLNFNPGGAWAPDRPVTNSSYKSLFSNVQVMAEYAQAFKQHDFRVLVGGSNESFISQSAQVAYLFTDSILGIPTSGTQLDPRNSWTTNATTPWGDPATIETSINSLFGRASYSFSNRYFAEFNFRYDGSSKFAAANRWGFFPSGSVAWRLSEESFFQGATKYVRNAKLRASYGILGNQNVNAYQYQTNFTNYNAAYGFNNAVVGGAGYRLGNPNLTWEEAATLNLGVDLTVLKGLDISFDYFNKVTSNILYRRSDVPQLFGAGFPDFNVAKVRNRGWELKLGYTHSGRIFTHSVMANLADNLNELLQLTSGATEEVFKKEEYELVRRVGQPITVYQGFRRNGYFQNLDDIKNAPRFANGIVTAGDVRYADRNGDGVIDDNDKFVLGNPFPRYTFGFTYTVQAKGFDLMVFVQGVGKRDQMLRGEQVEPFHVGYGGTMYTHQTDYWTPTNPNAEWPRLAENGSASNANNYKVGSDIFLFDAAYARLKNVQFGYTLPSRLSSKAGLSKVRIYFTGQNLATLSRIKFFDPEISEFNNNTNPNVGSNSARAYFMPVFVGGGLDLTF